MRKIDAVAFLNRLFAEPGSVALDVPEDVPGDSPARQAAGLLSAVADADVRADLRELFEHRAGVCEYCGALSRDEAEAVALDELRAAMRRAGLISDLP